MEPSPADGEGRMMVEVRNANMSYGSKYVLRGFNMTVPERSMYAFLGPSGCGKTTLLSCLVGEKTLDSGQISLGVRYKDQIGYMPQDNALSAPLTIGESVAFYSLLFGLNKGYMKENLAEILHTLDIPPLTSKIQNLSGGQQRRVSLCIALLHDPTLLILDEPTVGLDPLLSKRAWDYLENLVRTKNKTVIMTTHYVEEAKQADRVGMLRGGVLLVEDCPRALMAEHAAETLEAVFLRLSQRQEAEPDFTTSGEDVRHVRTNGETSDGQSPIRARQVFSPGHVVAHLWKNYYWMNHNKPVGVFLVSLSAVTILLFGLTFGREVKNMKVGIVNEELKNGVAVDCKQENTFNCSDPIHSSCWFVKSVVKRNVVLVDFEDEDSAIEAAAKNEVWGYIRVKENFTEAYMARQGLGLRTPPEVLDRGQISARIDMSTVPPSSCHFEKDYSCWLYYSCIASSWTLCRRPNSCSCSAVHRLRLQPVTTPASTPSIARGRPPHWSALSRGCDCFTPWTYLHPGHFYEDAEPDQIIGYSLAGSLHNAYIDYAAALYEACGWPEKASTIPILLERPVHESPFPDFTSNGMFAMLTVCLFFMQMMICCGELINEKVEGVLERNFISGLTYPETLLADAIYVMCFAVLQIVIMLSIIFLVFGMRLEGSLLLLVCVCVLICVSGLCFGILAATLTSDLIGVTCIGMGTLFAWVFMSGMAWPREGMHSLLRPLALFVPLNPAIDAVQAISLRGSGLAHPAVYSAFLHLPAWALLFLAATYLALKNNISMQTKQN